MNVCRPACQRQCQLQLKDHPKLSDAFLDHNNNEAESAFVECVDHATRLLFKQIADSIRLMVLSPAIHI